MKFSCPQCGQHISCGEAWAGHQLECPGCQNNILVPPVQAPSAPAPVSVPSWERSKAAGPKLAAGGTQVPRSTAPASIAARKFTPRPPRSDNALLKYGLLLALFAALAALGYLYGLPLVTKAFQQEPNATPSEGAKTSQTGGMAGGPMGEVSGAMDVSETLDGGSSPKSRPVRSTNTTARPQPAAKPR